MTISKKYVVLHDAGPEGWVIQAECDTLLDAARAREDAMASGGGRTEIFEHIQVFEAYRRADYEQDHEKRKATP